MSIPTLHEPLALVEFDLNVEKENSTDEAKYTAKRAIIEMMHNEKMVLPVLAAMLTSNGGASLYRSPRRTPHDLATPTKKRLCADP